MKNGKIALSANIIVLTVLAAMLAVVPLTLAQPPYSADSVYFLPEDSTGAYCQNNTIVQINVNTTVATTGVQMDIHFDPSCVNITAVDFTGSAWPPLAPPGWMNYGNYVRIIGTDLMGQSAGDWKFANITLHCIKDTQDCLSNINFANVVIVDNEAIPMPIPNVAWHNGTISCEAPPSSGETFDKYLYAGWNLISLPLIPEDNSTSAVLGGPITYDAVYRYNAIAKLFESVMGSTMDPGIGYFVHVTTAGTWNYNGAPYNSMDISLKQGLNMVGWLNCTKAISDGEYNYVASWNATEQEFESYNPVAPMSFNDFDAMDRGNGYFISAKTETTLTGSC